MPRGSVQRARFGELCVFRHLHTILRQGSIPLVVQGDGCDDVSGWSVEWVNEQGESGLPFDIRLKGPSKEMFIEVKTTDQMNKRVFEISLNELQCAREKAEDFFIARLFLQVPPRMGRAAPGARRCAVYRSVSG